MATTANLEGVSEVGGGGGTRRCRPRQTLQPEPSAPPRPIVTYTNMFPPTIGFREGGDGKGETPTLLPVG